MRFWTLLATTLVATPAMADFQLPEDVSGSYLCKATASAGLRLDGQTSKWQPTVFNVGDASYLVKVSATGRTGKMPVIEIPFRVYQITVKRFGTQEKPMACYRHGSADWKYPETEATSVDLGCDVVGATFHFDFNRMKFQEMFWGGYMAEGQNTDTPYVMIGVCDRVE